MRRLFVGVLVSGAAIFTLPGSSFAQRTTELAPHSVSVRATTIAELRTWDAFVTSAARASQLRLRSIVRDPMLPARVVERFDQFHEGVKIWGADVVRDSDRGVAQSVFGELAPPDLELSTNAALSLEDARTALLRLGDADGPLLVAPELVISRGDDGTYRLAYTGVVSANRDVFRAFVDAHTGAELMRYTELQSQQAAVGTGRGVLGDQKKVSVESNAGTYVAVDRLRPPTIQTFDLGGNVLRFIQLEAGRTVLSTADLARDADNAWSDVAIVDAQAHAGMTYDYYYKRFGRTGIDGRNGPINIVANAMSQQTALLVSEQDLNDYAINATWCASCFGGQGRVWFGNGFPSGYSYGGRHITYLAGSLDTVAHEVTHAVTTFTSNLVYRNESGALNEAFSDMMGKSVEFFYHPAGSGVGQADYVLGKDVFRATTSGGLNGIRSMANPVLYNHPDHYSRRYTGTADGGGVHINSGIANHAFYLAIEGGTNRTSGLAVQGVGGGNREQIEKVFYRAFTTLMPASATFSTARITTVQAARDLYGAGSTVERAVIQAWDAVGVTELTRMTTFTGIVPAINGSFYYYAITMPATGRYQAVLNWNDSSVDLDLMISRPGCLSYSCQLTRAESPTRRPETVCLDVRAGEQYWLRFENWSPRPTSYQIEQAISPTVGGSCTAPSATVDSSSDTGINKSSAQERNHGERLN